MYGKSDLYIDSLMHITKIYSNDIKMSFVLGKYNRMISKRGKMITAKGVELPEDIIADVQNTS